VIVEYAGILAAVSLLAATLTGAYGNDVAAVFASGTAGAAAAGRAAKAQGLAPAGARVAYKRAPYGKPALKYLYALGWIGGKKNPGQCGLATLGPDAATEQAEHDIRSNAKLRRQLRRSALTVHAAAGALVKGVVSACA
jgi:hypothetical protein